VLKPELNNISKLLLEKGYSISNAFKDAFKVGNYQQLFQLLKSMDQETVKQAVEIKDDLGRNIFHSLSKAPDESPFVEICRILIDEYKLDPNENDNFGNTPIMLAAQEGKLNLVKALECIGSNIKDTNYNNENCIHLLIKGEKIKRYNRKLMQYLIENGIDFNALYEESEYQSSNMIEEFKIEDAESNILDAPVYKCTPMIHLIRTQHIEIWDKGDLIEEIFKQNKQRINPNVADSDGRDIFMHLAILNEFEL